MDLLLTRDPAVPAPLKYQYGQLTVHDQAGLPILVLQTMEHLWIPNPNGAPCGHPDTSCVPVGTYQLAPHDTAAHPRTFALVSPDLGIYHEPADAPGVDPQRYRVACLIHAGNIVEQSKGCILVGITRSTLNGEPDVAASATALGRLLALVPWVYGHTLTIE